MARNLSVILILTFTLSVTNPLHGAGPATASPQTTEKIIPSWESGINVNLAITSAVASSTAAFPPLWRK